MANKFSNDEIRTSILFETDKGQQKIHELGKTIDELDAKRKLHLKTMAEEERKGRQGSDVWKAAKKQYDELGKQIKKNREEINEETKALNINNMTMAQLRKQSKALRKELDNLQESANPEKYKELANRLAEVDQRMTELKGKAKNLKSSFKSDQSKTYLIDTAAIKGVEIVTNVITSLISGIHDLADEGVEMARAADGITKAFNELNNPGLLDNLREATKGTVNDVELMKAAVQANDFRIPLDNLGKLLSFAQLKAQQTGQSVEYMTQSIVTGLGRKSVMILDNLGLSAAEINEELSKTGDFAQAVATIIDKRVFPELKYGFTDEVRSQLRSQLEKALDAKWLV